MSQDEAKLDDAVAFHSKRFSPEQAKLLDMLLSKGQRHLTQAWTASDACAADVDRMMAQLSKLNQSYPNGIGAYVDNSKRLLEASLQGKNPYDGFVVGVPEGKRLDLDTARFDEMERVGVEELGRAVFVLVAGGLGERLGYSGIKIALTSDLATGRCFARVYAEHILALQTRAGGKTVIPLVIMVSDDTQAKTVELFEANEYFGLSKEQVHLVKQEKVPALVDNDARFALDSSDPFRIATKPHGHGDVHALLHQSGLAKRFHEQGKRWVVFIQDTNALVFRGLPSALGVSATENFDMNSLTVPRKPGEAVGAICQLSNKESGRQLTINVEYNQLDPMLRATVNKDGDVADPKTGFSPYPGNINVLIMKLDSYARVLNETAGAITEFVNPKYKDESRTEFKKPTRLECMMQDYPKLLPSDARVGFTQLQRSTCFSAVKNNVHDGAAKQSKTGFAESAATGESDTYWHGRHLLRSVGVDVTVDAPKRKLPGGIHVQVGAMVVLSPSFGCTRADVRAHFPKLQGGSDESKSNSGDGGSDGGSDGGAVKISDRSTLVIDGADITIDELDLDGALVIRAVPGARVHVKSLKVRNKGWTLEDVDVSDVSIEEDLRVRGYRLQKHETRTLKFDEPGELTVAE